MKKSLISLALLVSVGLLISGCNDKQPDPTSQEGVYVDEKFEGAPVWVRMPHMDGSISEVGSAKKNAADDFSFQREEATADARVNLAKTLQVKVGNIFKQYKGTTSENTFDQASSKASEELTSEVLRNTRVKDTWINKKGTMFVWMYINTGDVSDKIGTKIKTSFNNNEAAYQQWLAERANGELNKKLEKYEASK